MEVYLDNSATTRVFDRVAFVMNQVMMEDYGNPSSMHLKGVEAEKYIRHATELIAGNLKVNPKEIFYTSGGTESDNLAIIGTAFANCRNGKHIITTMIEHPAVLQSMKYLEEMGFDVTYLPVDAKGCIRVKELECAIRKDTILVSIMYVNNEIGTIQPIAEIGTAIKRRNPRTLFHVDAVQAYGKIRIYPKRMNIDLLSVSGHKIHGPKGIGFLFVGENVKIKPLIHGGGQQKNMRSGTENVPGIAGLSVAVEEIYQNFDADVSQMYEMREYFISKVTQMRGITVNGPIGNEAAPHVVSISVQGIRAEVLLHALEEKGIYISAGSACSSNKPAVSATLQAIGLPKELLQSTVRFSFSVFTTWEELDYALEGLRQVLETLRKYTRK